MHDNNIEPAIAHQDTIPSKVDAPHASYTEPDFPDKETILCRCSDLTLDEVRKLIDEGYTSVDDIKRITRLAMGPCQGRNCIPLVLSVISEAINVPIMELSPGTFRPPTKAVSLGMIADCELEV